MLLVHILFIIIYYDVILPFSDIIYAGLSCLIFFVKGPRFGIRVKVFSIRYAFRGVKGQKYFDRVRSWVKKIKRHMPKVTQRSPGNPVWELESHLWELESHLFFKYCGNCCTGEWWYLIYVEFYVTYS